MPTPARLTVVETFPTATVTLSPPEPDDTPSVPAQQAWDNAFVEKRSDASYELVLARMNAQFPATMGPGGSTTPLYPGVLVWMVVTRGSPAFTSPGYSPPNAAHHVRACGRFDALDPTDATTGQHLFSDTFPTGT